ncbi:hypothetical protein N7G274_003228 [Stereocaulon virgatum]|uniref:Clr5 domain-containing protein n=2 Tax=Stereocaulon virgatum TaxID=373712 RepID=A0ABR4AD12_9LECA
MPRPTIAIPPEIEQWIKDQYCYEHKTAEELVQALANEHDIEMTSRTLGRRLQEWGCKKQTRVNYTFELVSRFLILFYQMVLDDKTITYILNVEGMSISYSNVARLRRKLGIRRRVRAGDYDIAWEELIAIVEREFHEGMLRNYGRNFLYAHFRRSQYLVSRYRLWEAVRIVDPEGIALRTGDANRKRGSYEVPGPNWIWSLDGYCKVELVEIQIYAAIDAFSRMVLWIYVGISGRIIRLIWAYSVHKNCMVKLGNNCGRWAGLITGY